MKLILNDGTEILLDCCGSYVDGDERELVVIGHDTDHPDLLSV